MTKKQWLIVTILTFITICAWVVFDIMHNLAKVEIPAKTQEIIKPLDPEFDTSSLQ